MPTNGGAVRLGRSQVQRTLFSEYSQRQNQATQQHQHASTQALCDQVVAENADVLKLRKWSTLQLRQKEIVTLGVTKAADKPRRASTHM